MDAPRWVKNKVLAEYLGVTTMTLHRWRCDPKLNFPQPSVVRGLPHTDLEAVDKWLKERVAKRPRELAKP
jgi:hypothetical protein